MNIRQCSFFFSLSAFSFIAGLLSPQSSYGDLPTSFNFNLVAVHTGKCLDLPGNNSNPGVNLQQWACNGGAAQQFKLTAGLYNGQVVYQLHNPNYPVNIYKENGSTNGSRISAMQGSGVASIWSLQSAGEGKWNFVNVESSRCLDIGGWNDGAPAQVYDCNGGQAQQFYLEPIGGHYTLTAAHSLKCIDIEGDSYSNNARVEQDNCNGSWTQQWKLIPSVSGTKQTIMFVNRASGRLIDLFQGLFVNGTAIQQYSYANNANQKWDVAGPISVSGVGNTYTISPSAATSAKCIDIEGNSNNAGANAQLWDCLGANNQRFRIQQ